MHRFYCPSLPTPPTAHILPDVTVELDRDQARHARTVLRLQTGDCIHVFDGRGTIGNATVEIGSSTVMAHIGELQHVPVAQPVIDVAAACPKGPRARDMVNQLSQAAADRFIPLSTCRSTVQPRIGKLEGLNRVTIESAKQSNRAHLMAIDSPSSIESVIARPYDLCLMADPAAVPNPGSPPDRIMQRILTAGHIVILIGPEGGWTNLEKEAVAKVGGLAWWLGPNVLRVETAAIAAVAIVRYLTSVLDARVNHQ